jgi:hypothetical protein
LTILPWILVGCFFSTAVGGLTSYENPKNKITAVPATDEEIWGATFKVMTIFLIQLWCNISSAIIFTDRK